MFGVGGVELAYLTAVFLLGGFVKGVISFGLPLVTVPLLSQIFPVPVAITLTLVSVLVSSVVQAYLCRRAYPILRQVWPLILPIGATIPVAALAAGTVDPTTLNLAIGVFIEVLVAVQWIGMRSAPPRRHRGLVLAAGGVLSGVFGGVTSFYSFPSVQMLVGMKLNRTEFALSTNVMFLVGSGSLAYSMSALGLYTRTNVALSLWGLVPLLAGLAAGQILRDRIPQETFRKMVLVMLALTGVSLIHRGL
ncbi:MAG: sulfite exporter TauE/SafE family protein [Rhodospirillales bacterium]|nr:sulfite exporter TauE/SafE family protein [Rhodospirillales bacterium]